MEEEVFEHEVAKLMRDGDLLPQKCSSCGSQARCYRNSCESCGSALKSTAFPADGDENRVGMKKDEISALRNKLNELEKEFEK